MTEVPALTPVTAPVEALMVATAGVAEDQAPPVTEELKVEVPLEQIAVVPEIVPAEGAAVTVTVLVATASAQPPVPVIVYEIVTVPGATPVTTPEEFTVATFVFELDQVPVTAVVCPFVQFEVVPVRAKFDMVAFAGPPFI